MRISDWSSDVCSSDLTTKEKIWSDRKRVTVQPIELRLRERNPASKRVGRSAVKQASRFHTPHPRAFDLAPVSLPMSEEGREGNECVMSCRYQWLQIHL